MLKKINVPSAAELRSKMEEYLLEHATDTGAEDERWRARLAKDVQEVKREVSSKVEAVNMKTEAKVAEVKQEVKEVSSKLEEVKQEVSFKLEAVNEKLELIFQSVSAFRLLEASNVTQC